MTKQEKQKEFFKAVLKELYDLDENFYAIEYRLLKAFDIMYARVKTFKNMSTVSQYQICDAAAMIAIGSTSKGLRESRILSRPKPTALEINYSLEYGFVQPEIKTIDITKKDILKLNQ